MGFKDQLRRLRRDVQKDMAVVKLKDGGTRVFADLDVFKEMFLCQYELLQGKARPSEVLDAVREATPESRDAFEAEYGSIEMEANILAPLSDGGWVESHRLLEDGTVESVRHEGDSEEAEGIRRGARERGTGSSFS